MKGTALVIDGWTPNPSAGRGLACPFLTCPSELPTAEVYVSV